MKKWSNARLIFSAAAALCGAASVACLPAGAASGPEHLSPADIAGINAQMRSAVLSHKGDAEAAKGNWTQAVADYQQALTLWPYNSDALYGMAAYSEKQGDTATALADYRSAVYTHPDPPGLPRIGEFNPDKLMEYVLMLVQVGQAEEALTVYQHAADLLNYDHGKPRLRVMLPSFGNGPGQLAYTSQRLQAMANVGICLSNDDDQKEASVLQQAISLAPDSAVSYYYLGRYQSWHSDPKAKDSFAKAKALGDETVGAAVDKSMKLIQ